MNQDTFLTSKYWSERYINNDTPWDLNGISEPLKAYIDQLTDHNLKILIPGAGSGYEVEYLYKNGFNKVFLIDISKVAIHKFRQRFPKFPDDQLIAGDFFTHSEKYDLIIEQTFFCALPPAMRLSYVEKMYNLLNTGGKLVGLLFDDPLNDDRPPFGGNKAAYKELFSEIFKTNVLDRCYNSIPPRSGRELFINFQKN